MMGICHQQFFNIVIIYRLHPFDAAAAAALALEVVNRHTLDIPQPCHGNNHIFFRD